MKFMRRNTKVYYNKIRTCEREGRGLSEESYFTPISETYQNKSLAFCLFSLSKDKECAALIL